MTKPLIKKHLQSRRRERKLVQEQASPWLRRGIPDLAYGTSALYSRFSLRDIGTLFPTLPTGHRHEVYSPGGGSLDARLPVKYTNRPGGGAKAVESSGAFCLGPLYTRSPISALMELGTECSPRLRSQAIVSSDFHRWDGWRHIVPSSSSQYLGVSERSCTGCFKKGDWMMICCSKVSWEWWGVKRRAPVGRNLTAK